MNYQQCEIHNSWNPIKEGKEENMTNHQKPHELSEKMNALKEELAVEYDNWMELQEV